MVDQPITPPAVPPETPAPEAKPETAAPPPEAKPGESVKVEVEEQKAKETPASRFIQISEEQYAELTGYKEREAKRKQKQTDAIRSAREKADKEAELAAVQPKPKRRGLRIKGRGSKR